MNTDQTKSDQRTMTPVMWAWVLVAVVLAVLVALVFSYGFIVPSESREPAPQNTTPLVPSE